jgi:hypothetical protein
VAAVAAVAAVFMGCSLGRIHDRVFGKQRRIADVWRVCQL